MRKKLIEVALPLDAINREAAREKSIRHGHPSTLHLWWARRPLAACRAVLFSSLVDDPDETEAPQEYLDALDALPGPGNRRDRLFRFIERLVTWENSNDEEIISTARRLILAATEGNPPPVLDPFCGGGSIPLEAQRLGLKAYASDLNPVAVLITKALIEIPPKFAGNSPVNPEVHANATKHSGSWKGAHGLAEDVRYYGQWMRDEAEKRIGHLYPKGPNGETVIAWLWARTVKCPNPACGATMPLVRSFELSKKKGKRAWVEPIVNHEAKTVEFTVRTGEGEPPEGTVARQGARCIVCGQPVEFNHVRCEGRAGRMGAQLLALVADGEAGREFISVTESHLAASQPSVPDLPALELSTHPQYMAPPRYGMKYFQDLFTPRQLLAMTTFCELVSDVGDQVRRDACAGREATRRRDVEEYASDPQPYADAVATYCAFAISGLANRGSSLASWDASRDSIRSAFARQAMSMTWDYAEANPFSESTGNFCGMIEWVAKALATLLPGAIGSASQRDAVKQLAGTSRSVISTDPPYYDNVPYADLSDFFYIWLRASLRELYPELLGTLLTPKSPELVADKQRHGSDESARAFFEQGLQQVFTAARVAQLPEYPMTVYYAFRQAEAEAGGSHVSTGWETMLQGLMAARFSILGTWPMRSELANRTRNLGSNALASSIVLVCRPQPESAPLATRREFLDALKDELPSALRHLQQASIAPVDMAQAAIGPGMAVFSRYSRVLETDGSSMSVRTALELINQTLDEVLAEQEGAFDADTRWAVAWFGQNRFDQAAYGDAETLSRAKNTSVDGMVIAGIVQSGGGKVRLLPMNELREDWDPTADKRVTVWEVTHYLIRALEEHGEHGAAILLSRVGGLGESARDLAYRLYSICERRDWSQEALGYNSLVTAWPEISATARDMPSGEDQRQMFE